MNSSRILNFVVLLAIILIGYYLWMLEPTLYTGGLNIADALEARLLLISGLLIECLIVLLLVHVFYPLRSTRILAYLAVAIYTGINLLQIVSFEISSDYVTRLAMGNVEFAGLLVTAENISIVLVVLFSGFILPLVLSRFLPLWRLVQNEFEPRAYPWRKTLSFAIIAILAGVLLNNIQRWVSQDVIQAKQSILRAHSIAKLKPLDAFFRLFKKQPESALFPVVSTDEIAQLRQYGFVLNPDKQFPLLKNRIYRSPPPFKRNTTRKPNVIVIFTEGFSTRTSSVYSHDLPGITPNLEDFASRSMTVENYYNHTAATYRGLHGGLCSLFPKYGALGGWLDSFKDIPKTNYKCLTDIFANNGYRRYYFDPHFKDSSGLDEMMKQLKFDVVINAEDMLSAYLGNEKSARREWLSDHQMYRALTGFLQQRDEPEPFFLTLYSVETHAWVDVEGDGIPYRDGKSNVLNTVHNMDDAFGLFWSYYQKSKYAEDTIVIFTSDHTHYYSKPFLKLMKALGVGDYQKLFIGTIPMIIHDPLAQLPPVYDAGYASSIDFAPSLVHLLGLPNEKNAFLGSSIFESADNRRQGPAVAAYGEKTYMIDREKIHEENQGDAFDNQLDLLSRYIRYVQGLEIKNRIYP